MNTDRYFFIIGPLRTGSSLMARCIDDHPEAMCLCESEINRALFKFYYTRLHAERMEGHGFAVSEVVSLLDSRKQDDISTLMSWYRDVRPRIAALWGKRADMPLGDKSPDFFESPAIVEHLAANHRLIYTVRDPRAIFLSVDSQTNVSPRLKQIRWDCLAGNYVAWRPFLHQKNVLFVRFEDFVAQPEATMKAVYAHLELPYSSRFLEPFARPCPRRFLWTTAIDWATGAKKDFDVNRTDEWKGRLTVEQLRFVVSTPHVREFMLRFGYT
jgi:Sulfotransferase family